MNSTFSFSYFNNNSISNWDISNVKNISFVFCNSLYNGDISSWNLNNGVECVYMFVGNHNFLNKYNNGENVSIYSFECLQWLNENREKIKEINNPKEEVLDFFSFDDKKEIGL